MAEADATLFSLRMELNSRQFESFVKPNAG